MTHTLSTAQNMAVQTTVVQHTDLAVQMGDLLSREGKKAIPTFDGETNNTHVSEWIRSAEKLVKKINS